MMWISIAVIGSLVVAMIWAIAITIIDIKKESEEYYE